MEQLKQRDKPPKTKRKFCSKIDMLICGNVNIHWQVPWQKRKQKNKNVDTFGFVQFYIISQHCLWYFKSHDFSIKLHSCHKHKCCPTMSLMNPSLTRGYHRQEERFGNWNITFDSIHIFSWFDYQNQVFQTGFLKYHWFEIIKVRKQSDYRLWKTLIIKEWKS